MGHTGKAEVSTQTPQNNESPSCMSEDPKLLWLIGTLNGQQQPMLLDSGATVCCLAKRCFTASRCLQNLTLQPYSGLGLFDANGQVMKPCGTIKVPLVVGQPAVSQTVEFVIIDALPYSCIISLSFLNKFSRWGLFFDFTSFDRSKCADLENEKIFASRGVFVELGAVLCPIVVPCRNSTSSKHKSMT